MSSFPGKGAHSVGTVSLTYRSETAITKRRRPTGTDECPGKQSPLSTNSMAPQQGALFFGATGVTVMTGATGVSLLLRCNGSPLRPKAELTSQAAQGVFLPTFHPSA